MLADPLALAADLLENGPDRDFPTPGDLAAYLDPRTVQTPALQLLDEHLLGVADGRIDRLIWTMPPQEGKSQRISRFFPLWLLLRNPDLRIAIVSYEADIARRWGRAIRNEIVAHPELGLAVRHDTSAAHEWQLDGHLGGVITAGIGGALTGRPVDCVSQSTHIECEYGQLTAAEAYSRGIRRILAYDHTTGRAVWRDVEASRRISGRRVIEITTAAGRTLVCTPDHRVYTGRGYLPAGQLRTGDTLRVLVAADRVPLRQPQGPSENGDPQSHPAWPSPVLHTGMHGGSVQPSQSDPAMRVRQTRSEKPPLDVLEGVRDIPTSAAPDEEVPAVLGGVHPPLVAQHVLHAELREPGALPPHDRTGQLALQDRHQLCTLVPVDEATDPVAGQRSVRGVLYGPDDHLRTQGWQDGASLRADRPSHQRGRNEQPARESDHAVRGLPRRPPQVEADTVAMVRDRGGETVDVYDFQVAGTRNFFGDGILVHNCLIIDDPVKGRKEADSETYREACWSWWTESGSTRLAPGAPVILLMTRWHEDDLAGRLLASESAEEWIHVNVPALADHDPAKGETDPLGRSPGEWLQSARRRTEAMWERIRRQVGSRAFAALYQGRPAPAEGGILKRAWWRFYPQKRAVQRSDGTWHAIGAAEVVLSVDCAFKDTKASDWVVIQVWARRGTRAWLLHQVRDRLDMPATTEAIKQVAAAWPQAKRKLIEEKANGAAVIQTLRGQIGGLIPINPTDSKESRANAVAPFIEAGDVELPDPSIAPWVAGFVDECSAFPNASHDDQVDGMTQALQRLLMGGGAGRFMQELMAEQGAA